MHQLCSFSKLLKGIQAAKQTKIVGMLDTHNLNFWGHPDIHSGCATDGI